MPEGFGKIFEYGLGFPRRYRGFVREIESVAGIDTVLFGSDNSEGQQGNVFHVSLQRFSSYKQTQDRNRARGATVVSRVNDVATANSVADLLGRELRAVTIGRHPIIQAITREVTENKSLDADDRTVLTEQMTRESKATARENPVAFVRLRQDVEIVSLEVLIERFEALLSSRSANSESVWQSFFEENTFALQQVFSAPIALFGSQLHVKMPNVHGAGGRIADFVLVNTVTASAVVVEIKTPGAGLLGALYRGKGGAEVFPPSHELAGSVAQLQSQMSSVLSDFRMLLNSTPGSAPIDTGAVTGAVVIRRAAGLTHEQLQSLARYRAGLHGVVIITFDEICDRLRGLLALIRDSVGAGTQPA